MGERIFVATETFHTNIGDEQFTVHRGKTRVREGHKLVKAHPGFFEPVEDGLTFDMVERATAAPGEKRGVKRGQRATAAPGEKDPEA